MKFIAVVMSIMGILTLGSASLAGAEPAGSQGAVRGLPPVLGSKGVVGPYLQGFGTVKPKRLNNGIVPSGIVHNIRWKRWGKRVAFGVALGHQYRPEGGYYSKHVKVRLRARKLGYCGSSSRLAYTNLWVRIQKKPGGKFTKWFNWAGSMQICEW